MAEVTEIVRLAPLERTARNWERISRLATGAFLGLALMQFLGAALLMSGVDIEILDTSDSAVVRQVIIGGVLWFGVALFLTIALTSGPRAVAAIFAFLMSLVWFALFVTTILTAAGAAWFLNAAWRAGQFGEWAWPRFGLVLDTQQVLALFAVALTLPVLISLETVWASARGFITSVSRSSHEIKLVRGLRGLGPFSPSGLLATFDLPVVMRARGSLAGKALSLLAILMATIGIAFWLNAPWAAVMAIVGITEIECGAGGEPSDVERGSCLLAKAPILTEVLLLWLVGIICICAIAALLMQGAKRLLADSLERRSDGAPIIFLRSFADDQARVRAPWRGPLDILLDLGRAPDSMDQILVYEFARHGPVLALGKPGEKRPPFGARRIYAEHATWQDDISAMIDKALACVLVVDRSEGLRWELEQSLQRAQWRERTLFIMPRREDFERWRIAAGIVDVPELPRREQIVGAVALGGQWRFYVSRRPTRATYQILARSYFARAQVSARV